MSDHDEGTRSADYHLYDLVDAMDRLDRLEAEFKQIKDDYRRTKDEIARISKFLNPALAAAGDVFIIPVHTSRGIVHLKYDRCDAEIVRVPSVMPHQVKFPEPDAPRAIEAGNTVYRDDVTGKLRILGS